MFPFTLARSSEPQGQKRGRAFVVLDITYSWEDWKHTQSTRNWVPGVYPCLHTHFSTVYRMSGTDSFRRTVSPSAYRANQISFSSAF